MEFLDLELAISEVDEAPDVRVVGLLAHDVLDECLGLAVLLPGRHSTLLTALLRNHLAVPLRCQTNKLGAL